MVLKKITHTEEIKKAIQETWEGDDTFFEKYAVNATEELSIKDTTEKVLACIEEYGGEFYVLSEAGKNIGYINIAPKLNMLFSFGLKRDYRTEENKRKFLLIIDSLFPEGQIAVSLYKKNTRAINFFLNNGYEEQECITLIKNK